MKAVRNDKQRVALLQEISTLPLPFQYQLETDLRTLEQNALSHVWYGQLAKQLREDSEGGWRCFCKLRFGVPIMRGREDGLFRDRWDRLIKNRFTYEEKLELMIDFPVTSLMEPDEMGRYLTAMQQHFASKHSIRLVGRDKGESEYPEVRRQA